MRMRHKSSSPCSFFTPAGRGVPANAVIFRRILAASAGGNASNSLRADRAKVMA